MYIVFMGYRLLLWLLFNNTTSCISRSRVHNEKKERREERCILMYLIKIQVFAQVTKFSTERYTLVHIITALWQMWVASESLNAEWTSWQILANRNRLTLMRWL